VQQAIKFGSSQQVSLQPNATLPNTPLLEGAPQVLAELMPTSNATQSGIVGPSLMIYSKTYNYIFIGLYLNGIRPAGVTVSHKLPVIVVHRSRYWTKWLGDIHPFQVVLWLTFWIW